MLKNRNDKINEQNNEHELLKNELDELEKLHKEKMEKLEVNLANELKTKNERKQTEIKNLQANIDLLKGSYYGKKEIEIEEENWRNDINDLKEKNKNVEFEHHNSLIHLLETDFKTQKNNIENNHRAQIEELKANAKNEALEGY